MRRNEKLNDSGPFGNTLQLDGISPAQLKVFVANGDWLAIDYAPQEAPLGGGAPLADSDRVAIINGRGGAIERIVVGGEALSWTQLVGRYATAVQAGTNARS